MQSDLTQSTQELVKDEKPVFTDSIVEVTSIPLLCEHTIEILRDVLGYEGKAHEQAIASGAASACHQKAAE